MLGKIFPVAPTAGQEQREHQEGLQVMWQRHEFSPRSAGTSRGSSTYLHEGVSMDLRVIKAELLPYQTC